MKELKALLTALTNIRIQEWEAARVANDTDEGWDIVDDLIVQGDIIEMRIMELFSRTVSTPIVL